MRWPVLLGLGLCARVSRQAAEPRPRLDARLWQQIARLALPKGELVFVYGSLLTGMSNHAFLTNRVGQGTRRSGEGGGSTLIGSGKTLRNLVMVPDSPVADFPFAIDLEACVKCKVRHDLHPAPIVGELYDVDRNVLDELDDLEQHPDIYQREKMEVSVLGQQHTAWVYLLVDAAYLDVVLSSPKDHPQVPGGDWRAYEREQHRPLGFVLAKGDGDFGEKRFGHRPKETKGDEGDHDLLGDPSAPGKAGNSVQFVTPNGHFSRTVRDEVPLWRQQLREGIGFKPEDIAGSDVNAVDYPVEIGAEHRDSGYRSEDGDAAKRLYNALNPK